MDGTMYPAEVCYLDDMYTQPRPWGFSLRKWEGRPWGAPPICYEEAVGTRLSCVMSFAQNFTVYHEVYCLSFTSVLQNI